MTYHTPVLLREVVDQLRPRSRGLYVDATVGGGGHAEALLEAGVASVIGLDRDREALAEAGQRLTSFGRFLRASSLDELPELFSVLNGDMSLVGPRPLLMEYLPLYTPAQARRHEVRPWCP